VTAGLSCDSLAGPEDSGREEGGGKSAEGRKERVEPEPADEFILRYSRDAAEFGAKGGGKRFWKGKKKKEKGRQWRNVFSLNSTTPEEPRGKTE